MKNVFNLFLVNVDRISAFLKSFLVDGRFIAPEKMRWKAELGGLDDLSLAFTMFDLDGFKVLARVSVVPLAELGLGMVCSADASGGSFLFQDRNGITWFAPADDVDPVRAVELAKSYRKSWVRYRVTVTAYRACHKVSSIFVDGVEGDTFPEPDISFDRVVRALAEELVEDAKIKLPQLFGPQRYQVQ